MKIRWTARSLRLRLDDLEVTALARGETVREVLGWPELGWQVSLAAGEDTAVEVRGPALQVQLSAADLADLQTAEDGLQLPGAVRLVIERDYLPEHTR